MRRLAVVAVLVACGGETPVVVEPPDDSSTGGETPGLVTDPGPDAPATATARGATAEEATANARRALREHLFGAELAATDLPLGEGTVEVETTSIDDTFDARIVIDEERMKAMIASLPERLPPPSFTGEAGAPLVALHEAAVARIVCERERALFATECAPPDLEPAIRAAADATRALRLVPSWQGGVPTRAEGLLRKPAVRIVRGDAPATGLAGLPLVASPANGEGVPIRTTADAQGRALLTTELEGPLVVRLDRSRLVPPLDSVFPALEAIVAPRPVGLQRWALVLADDQARDASARPAFGDALASVLQSRGAAEPVELSRGARRAVKVDGAGRAAAIREVADAQGGAVDVVLVATVESHFASRMGSRRVWYEAAAEVTAHLAWTGEVLGTFEARANDSGIGDVRAERAAREKVARDVAAQIADRLGPGGAHAILEDAMLEGAVLARRSTR